MVQARINSPFGKNDYFGVSILGLHLYIFYKVIDSTAINLRWFVNFRYWTVAEYQMIQIEKLLMHHYTWSVSRVYAERDVCDYICSACNYNWIVLHLWCVFLLTVHPAKFLWRLRHLKYGSNFFCWFAFPTSHGSAVWSATVIFVSPVAEKVPRRRVFREKIENIVFFSVVFPFRHKEVK